MSSNANEWLVRQRWAKPDAMSRIEEKFTDNGFRDLGTDFTTYVPADGTEETEDFRLWMHLLNRVFFMNTGLGVFDHEDRLWRDAFDEGLGPAEAYVYCHHEMQGA